MDKMRAEESAWAKIRSQETAWEMLAAGTGEGRQAEAGAGPLQTRKETGLQAIGHMECSAQERLASDH